MVLLRLLLQVDQGASRTGSAFTFVTCNNANVVGVLRYVGP
uniref:Uncharacterized protein n=1 Tax=Brassica campestris TaxID=3711 RepID=A0A3P6APW9_BRACM|nr:unnamed protein product [Brassica rapa]